MSFLSCNVSSLNKYSLKSFAAFLASQTGGINSEGAYLSVFVCMCVPTTGRCEGSAASVLVVVLVLFIPSC